MDKRSVNLIIKRSTESPLLIKFKIILPAVSVVALGLFVIFFFSSIIYINNNNNEFKAVNTQIDSLEKKISGNKNTEGIYILTVSRIKTIGQLTAGNKNYASLLSEVLKLQSSGITISQTAVDKKNAVTVAVIASSAATLGEFTSTLLQAEAENIFSDIKSSGVVRDKNGAYLLTISLKPNSKLLQ